ncbi:MAG TPA: helix-turn-helix domain-containing protein [Acetobacteraceae bacterium]|nr:helix-turn-helix domain-containing protein [Acetobacteraceae bacterium]
MGMDLMARYRLPAADRAGSALGADLLRRRGGADRVEILVVHPDGTREQVNIPASATGVIGDILAALSQTEAVAVLAEDAEISPEDAAAVLGISRPLVRRRMDAGVLPFRRVGAHRRLRLADVLELKRQEAPVRAALGELQADTDELMANER